MGGDILSGVYLCGPDRPGIGQFIQGGRRGEGEKGGNTKMFQFSLEREEMAHTHTCTVQNVHVYV